MPKPLPRRFGNLSQDQLFDIGTRIVTRFCLVNRLLVPRFNPVGDIRVNACAYYRPETGIVIQLNRCARPAKQAQVRNWNWPGNTVDREPIGVLAHELGHHVDYYKSSLDGLKTGSYYGEYSINLRKESGESQISGYCDNDSEWFAEIFRVFVLNHALLRELRPKAHALLVGSWEPISAEDWRTPLGEDVPQRIIRSIKNKL